MPGELVILAARPGVGKTTLGMQIALHNARKSRPTLFASLEMTADELASRLASGLTGINIRKLRGASISAPQIEQITAVGDDLLQSPLRIWSPPSTTLQRLRAVAKCEAGGYGLSLLVVDYLGLIKATDGRKPRYEQVGEISAGLKALAKELSIPVLALCQLNREADGELPRLSHLRDSGSIEQDADVVMFIHRTPDACKLIVAKHRHGMTDEYTVKFNPSESRFEDLSAADMPNFVPEFDVYNNH
jgi:replicative DNA helicase